MQTKRDMRDNIGEVYLLLYSDGKIASGSYKEHQLPAMAMLMQIKSTASGKGNMLCRKADMSLSALTALYQDISAIPVVGGSSSSSSLLERKPSDSSISSS